MLSAAIRNSEAYRIVQQSCLQDDALKIHVVPDVTLHGLVQDAAESASHYRMQQAWRFVALGTRKT